MFGWVLLILFLIWVLIIIGFSIRESHKKKLMYIHEREEKSKSEIDKRIQDIERREKELKLKSERQQQEIAEYEKDLKRREDELNLKAEEKQKQKQIQQAENQKIIDNATSAYKVIEQNLAVSINTDLPTVAKLYMKDIPEIKISRVQKDTEIADLLSDFIVIDVETTGLSPELNDILEISAVRYRNFEVVSHMTTLINPKKKIPSNITRINGITNGMVANAPVIEEVAQSFIDYIDSEKIIIAHNIEFDLKFFYSNGINLISSKRKFYDTLAIARSKIKKSNILNYKLETLLSYYEIFSPIAHRALYDCIATGILFKELINDESF